jgi:hypothetical protein
MGAGCMANISFLAPCRIKIKKFQKIPKIERDLNQLKKTKITGNANCGKQNKTHFQKMRCNRTS